MNHIVKKALGYTMLCSPLLAALILVACKDGLLVSLSILGVGMLIAGAIYLGARLLSDE